ncbi:MAG: general secretion pathway protein GspK [Candidatus Omnitrophica bacterium]|nr:general secretion pathway protein GspK [Candidatus Omnitrophota bacterium]
MRRFRSGNKTASILVLALWVVVFITVFAVNIGLRIRQRVTLVARIEDRSQLHQAVRAGIKKAIAVLRKDLEQHAQIYTSAGKASRHNNITDFKDIPIGGRTLNVFYREDDGGVVKKYYGFQDEERKININRANRIVLQNLMRVVAGTDEDAAVVLAESIIEWREFGQTQAEGFNSEGYYATLEYPYELKDFEFEVIDELMLVRGFTPDMYEKVRPYITIYGDGLVNINTAPQAVLLALGLSPAVAQKLLFVRRGVDELESTKDDYIFYKTFDVATEMTAFVELAEEEIAEIDALNIHRLIKTNSRYFQIQSRAYTDPQRPEWQARGVYDSTDNLVVYWREK